MSSAVGTPLRSDIAAKPNAAERRWSYQYYFAAFGVAVIVYSFIGWASYVASGPVQITKYRDTHATGWWVAWVYQSLSIATLLVMLTYVVRKVIREKRFVIEAQFCVAGLLTYWQDPVSNFLQPLFMNSANWINLNEWTGNLPGVRNPDAGRMPEDVLFGLPLYISGFLAFAKIMGFLLDRLRRRFPAMSTPQLIGAAMLIGMLIDASLEIPLYLAGLWAYPGQPDVGVFPHSGHKYPVTESLAGGLFFGVLTAMLYFRDDRGRSVMERGLERKKPAVGILLSQLALVGVFNATYLVDNVWWIAWGLDSGTYKPMAPNTVAGLCDTPGITGTNYGPCPGSPGYRVPLPGSLRCPKPGGNAAALNGPTPCASRSPVVIDTSKAHY